MKKLLFAFLVCITSFTLYAQIDNEEKLAMKPQMNEAKIAYEMGNVDCKCNQNNLVMDGGFQNLSVGGTLPSDITTSSLPWAKGYNTPQWSNTVQSPCDKGVVSMWGNKTVGESIHQNGLTFAAGTYTVKFTARFISPTSLSTLVRLNLTAYNGTGAPSSYSSLPSFASPDITSASWETYSFTFTTTGANSISLHPENNYTQNDGAYVSWIQLDKICIEKKCKIPDEKCSPNFSAAAFTVNAQGNVVINVNPVITGGAQHYWGLLGASGIGDNTAIPLSTIMSGGTFGLGVTSTGVATPIGMGTGITASTSGYGYSYQGVVVGKCFKITHYIKCCSKWYSQTNTYCTKLCVEVKEGGIIEMNDKEADKAEGVQAEQGRG